MSLEFRKEVQDGDTNFSVSLQMLSIKKVSLVQEGRHPRTEILSTLIFRGQGHEEKLAKETEKSNRVGGKSEECNTLDSSEENV